MTLSILQITRDAPPRDNGGISSAVGALIRATSRYGGIDHRVVSFDGWRPREAGVHSTLDAESERCARLSSPAQLDAATRWCIDRAADVLHVHDPLLWEFATEVRGRLQIPAVYTAHIVHRAANDARNLSAPTRSLVCERRALLEADAVHVASNAAARWLVRDGVAPEKIRVIRWPASPPDDTPFGADARSVPELEVDAQCGANARSATAHADAALVVSRFGYLKGTDLAFELLSRWLATDRGARVAWLGGLPDSPKKERRWKRRWAKTANAPGIAERLQFVGWRPHPYVLGQLTPARLVLSTSRHESFGLSVAEAMTRGCAVAAVRCEALEELLGVDGALWLDARESDQAAHDLATLRRDAALRERLGRRSRHRIRALCEPKARAAEFSRFYQHAAASSLC